MREHVFDVGLSLIRALTTERLFVRESASVREQSLYSAHKLPFDHSVLSRGASAQRRRPGACSRGPFGRVEGRRRREGASRWVVIESEAIQVIGPLGSSKPYLPLRVTFT